MRIECVLKIKTQKNNFDCFFSVFIVYFQDSSLDSDSIESSIAKDDDDDSRTFRTPSPVRRSGRIRTPIKCNSTTCYQTCGGTCGRSIICKTNSQPLSPISKKSKDIYEYTSSDSEDSSFDFMSVYNQAKKTQQNQ